MCSPGSSAAALSCLLTAALLLPPPASTQPSDSGIATERIFEALELREGMTVCEVGAGSGELSVAAANVVGTTGRVYTNELGEERVGELRRNVERSGLPQVTVVAGEPTGTNFPDGACDAVFMRNVYHHFHDPAAMNAAIARSMRPGARLAVVDFAPRGREADSPAGRAGSRAHGITAPTLARELAEAGFEPVADVTGSERWFMLVVSAPSAVPAAHGVPLPSR